MTGMQENADRIRRADAILLGLDYDGTLTPIVDDPGKALLPERMRQTLWALARRDDVTLAVISGRAHADLQTLVGIPGLIYAGNHGLEISGPGISFLEPAARAASRELHELAQELARKVHHIPGTLVEDKGLTLSVHYRRVAPVDVDAIRDIVVKTIAPRHERFHITLGNKVYEIRPRIAWNKGAALTWIKQRLNRPDALVIYLGDDTTDEDAFRTLAADGITIRVGDEAETAAAHRLPDVAAVQRFLAWVNELRESRAEPVRLETTESTEITER